MKTILVPTDFSESADNALNFAIRLAGMHQGNVILFHAYEYPYPAAPVPYSLFAEERNLKRAKTEEMLKSEAVRGRNAVSCNIKILASEGLASEEILKVAKKKKASLIIMGGKGAGFSDEVFGSTTSKVLQQATCPVIALPDQVKFSRPIKNITYATDYHQSDIAALKEVVSLAQDFNAKITILHIEGQELTVAGETKMMNDFASEVRNHILYRDVSFQIMHGENVEELIEEYISNGEADMLVMSTQYRGLLKRLFGRSLTREIARANAIPLLVFHYTRESALKLY
jgi:nucleotide-binding universal stress UspA family protein